MSRDDEKSEAEISVAVLCDVENSRNGDLAPAENLGVTVGERQGWALDDVALHSTFSENCTWRDCTAEGACERLLLVG